MRSSGSITVATVPSNALTRRPFFYAWWLTIAMIVMKFLLFPQLYLVASPLMSNHTAYLALYANLALGLICLVLGLRWWRVVGLRQPISRRSLWAVLPLFVVYLLQLFTRGIHIPLADVGFYIGFYLLYGFIVEVLYRGLILSAFQPRGDWYAALASSLFFTLEAAASFIYDYQYVLTRPGVLLLIVVALGYEFTLGFALAALKLRTLSIWPLILATALGQFVVVTTATPIVPRSHNEELLVVVEMLLALIYGVVVMPIRHRAP